MNPKISLDPCFVDPWCFLLGLRAHLCLVPQPPESVAVIDPIIKCSTCIDTLGNASQTDHYDIPKSVDVACMATAGLLGVRCCSAKKTCTATSRWGEKATRWRDAFRDR